jgi:SAM-dependent methyltransferase
MDPKNESDLPDHVRRNRAAWDRWASRQVEPGKRAWAKEEPTWGIWNIPESEAHLLPSNLKGLDAIELGCGTAYVSSWLARRGARVIGIDNSEMQLNTARALQKQHGVFFPLIHGNAECVPLPDASFDLAISEYGASIWCDPYLWIPEASRLLRPGGQLIFLDNGTIFVLCMNESEDPATSQLQRDYFGMHRFESLDADGSVEFHLGYGDWIRLLTANGFEVQDLKELRPLVGATTSMPYIDLEWARRWPSEEVWIARKSLGASGQTHRQIARQSVTAGQTLRRT